MRIAAITDDGETISQHFGRARHYKVFTVEDGEVVGRELRDKAGHHDFAGQHGDEHGAGDDPRGHGFGQGAGRRHAGMIEAIRDCDVVLVRGMGRGAHVALQEAGVEPIVTDIVAIEDAVAAYLRGDIENHVEWLH